MGFFRKNATTPPEPGPEEDNDIQLSAFVLLSEPLIFTGNELVSALRDDFPDMEWGGSAMEELMGDMPRRSAAAVITQFGIGPDLKPTLVNALPGSAFRPPPDLCKLNELSPESTAGGSALVRLKPIRRASPIGRSFTRTPSLTMWKSLGQCQNERGRCDLPGKMAG